MNIITIPTTIGVHLFNRLKPLKYFRGESCNDKGIGHMKVVLEMEIAPWGDGLNLARNLAKTPICRFLNWVNFFHFRKRGLTEL